ncbi:branched-chain amino acid ABC transporter ATP-binding protein/permease [Variovorax sp. RA8]|uniref:branched-chain amino acid ABC transporter ATP-binding protein/permease n=1 Tax=Variovorax sp. (strain JCM 16519 / RA8) TaxID=662548 RepID=UPI001316EBAB|nr:branched-chain amino acid ABC transporter ATP-binding protein/permease [Variovorax sp. RA8]VTU41874.1 Sulfate/thiosulfate import ATP-binding protein CysA [Variovorax sp. RA8]
MRRRAWMLPAAAVATAAAVALFASSYYVTLASFVLLYATVALGLTLMTGFAGLISFGQAAFVGIGAYAAGYLAVAHGVPGWLTLLAGVSLATLAAAGIGALTLSMGGHYLSLATLAWGVVVYYGLGIIEPLGGFNGLPGIPALTLLGLDFASERSMFCLIAAGFALAFWLVRNLLDSRVGRAVRALRAGADLPEAFGAHAFRLKVAVFCTAAGLAGMAGWLYVYMQRFLNPTPFGLQMSIEYLFMAVMGGVGALWGALAGAGVVVVLKQLLQDVLPALLGRSGNFEMAVFGVLMLVILARANAGLWPLLARFARGTRGAGAGAAAKPAGKEGDPLALVAPQARVRDAAGEVLLRVDAAEKRFGGLVAVDRVSFEVRAGEIVALLGPNGAGKSTLFNLITGLLPASSGAISLRGQRIDALGARQVAARGVARTFQHVKLVGDMNVLDNAALGCHLLGRHGWLRAMLRLDRREEAAIEAMAMAQLRRCGLAELAGSPAASLPLGKQRVLEIARALCARPQMLLLDEPAAGLRHKEKQTLAALLKQLRGEGVTVLIVDHDMEFIMDIADRLVVMQFGQKIAEGEAQAVRDDPRVQQAYLGGAA